MKQADGTTNPGTTRVPATLQAGALFVAVGSVALSVPYPGIRLWCSVIWTCLFVSFGAISKRRRRSTVGRFLGVAGDVLAFWALLLLLFSEFNYAAPVGAFVLACAYLVAGIAAKKESSIFLSCGLYSAGTILLLSLIAPRELTPLLIAVPVVAYYALGSIVSKKKTWLSDNLFFIMGHLTVVYAAIGIIVVRPAELQLQLIVCVFYPVIYAALFAISRQVKYLAGLLLFGAGMCYVLAEEVLYLSAGNALIVVALVAVGLVIASRLLSRVLLARVRNTFCLAAAAIAVISGGVVLGLGEPGAAKSVLIIGAVVYLLLSVFLKRNIFLYLLTLNLGLIAYNFIQTSRTHFTQELFIYFIYCLIFIGYFFVHPYLRETAKNRRSFLLVTVIGWKGVLLYALPVGGMILLALSLFSTRVAEHPQFCGVCHYMDPYVDSWEVSTHKDVNCLLCHYAPGIANKVQGKFDGMIQLVKYVSGAYSLKPHAEIPDAACLREGCHANMDNDKEVTYRKNIKFSHAHHLEERLRNKKLRCASCHSQIVQGDHITVKETVCFLCHFKERAESGVTAGTCRSCHGEPEGEMVYKGVRFNHKDFSDYENVNCVHCHTGVTKGDGSVPKERCLSCHVEHSEAFSDSKFMHENHVTNRKVECFECHLDIEHGAREMTQQLSPNCNSCHGDRHNIAEEMYMGTGALGVESSPDPMFLADVTCEGCHKYEETILVGKHSFKTKKAKPESCVDCHDADYAELVTEWQSETKEIIGELSTKFNKLYKLVGSAKPQSAKQVNSLLEKVKANLAFVVTDASLGAHNYSYAQAVLETVEEDLATVEELLTGDR